MAFLDKNGLQTLTNKLVQGDAIKVASHRGHTVKNVIDNITRECENVATPNTMTLENRVNEFKVGKGRDVDVSGDVEEGKVEVGLEGKTWQNLIPKISTTDWQIRKDYGEIFEDGSAKLTKHTAVDFRLKLSSDIKYMIKPNTVYTFAYTIVENYGNLFIRGQNSSPFTEEPYKSLKKGFHIYKLTSKSTITESMLQIYYTDSNSTIDAYAIIKDIILLEGDHTQTPLEELPKYFEGIKSSFEDGVVDIEVQGKNLFDGVYRFDYLQGGDVTIYCERESGDTRLALVKVEPYTTYTIKKESSVRNTMALFKEFPKDGDYYKGIVLSDLGTTIKTGDNNYLAVYVSNESEEPFLQVEKLNYPTPYEPYYKKKISFNIGEPLRSLPNGVCDEIRNNNGQWELVRKIGKVILDGTEKWEYNTGVDCSTYSPFYTRVSNKKIGSENNFISDRFMVKTSLFAEREAIWGETTNTVIYIKILNSKLSSLNTAGVQKWLSQNPTTVYYELQTPIVTPIDPIEFEVKPLATMTINSDIAPTSNHKVILNRAGQIEQGIVQIAELKSRVDALETAYDSYLLETQHKLSLLGFEYELESEEI